MFIALHAPDGFLEPPVALATAVISLAVVAVVLRRASAELGEKHAPLAGLAAAFVFAAQMVNFPVASGTTGHLLGGALVAVLLGPSAGALVVAVVVVVQALMFADGGITALGYNTLNMAIVPALGGWALFCLFRRLFPANASGVIGATSLAAAASVVLSAAVLSVEWLFGASAPVPFDTVFGAMVGVHLLIGIGEGVISGLVVAAVLASRPDLVAGASDLDRTQLAGRAPLRLRTFAIGAVLASLVVAMVVSQFAADGPDGLERVTEDHALTDGITEHALGDTLFANYATDGLGNEVLSLAVAGVVGVTASLAVGFGLVSAARRARGAAGTQ